MHAEIHFKFQETSVNPITDEQRKQVWKLMTRAQKQLIRDIKKLKLHCHGHFIYTGDEPFYAPLLRN